jgi:hypothetical protein
MAVFLKFAMWSVLTEIVTEEVAVVVTEPVVTLNLENSSALIYLN